MDKQHTIAKEVSFSGIGIHTGNLTTISFRPAPPDSGVTFYRADLPNKPAIKADIDHIVDNARGTTIAVNGAEVKTVEHVMAAIVGMGLDNVAIEVDANEAPIGDGSALPFMTALKKAGSVEQDAERKYIKVKEPVYYREDDVTLSVLPSDVLRITMTIAYSHIAIGTQYASFTITPESFEKEVAPARTYCLMSDVRTLLDQGLIQGGSIENAIIIGDEGILNEGLRYPDEFVRHKVLDILGDLFLLGRPVIGHVIAVKSGHGPHHKFAQEIKKALLNGNVKTDTLAGLAKPTPEPALDVNIIMKALPHRFPFLLVDRILTFDAGVQATAIKNVTINEPYFQGHWPKNPVMPGVLIIEAMAQVSSVLIFGSSGEPDGKQAYFLGINNAKFRKTVVPGDQIVIESRMVRRRRNACRVAAVAKVDGEVAAECEMLFGLQDAPQ